MKSIAIIGSGISGLFLANLLEKNTSFSYKIFEKKPNIYCIFEIFLIKKL